MNGYKFEFKDSSDLTAEEIEKSYQLNTLTYPDFARFYEKNRFYSSIRPQKQLMVWDGDKLIGNGKFQWKDLEIPTIGPIKFFVFGFLVEKNYQNQGVGAEMLGKYVTEAQRMGGDLLYGTTENPIAASMMTKFGFKSIQIPLNYTDVLSKELVEFNQSGKEGFAYEFRDGLVDRINNLSSLDLGIGPL